LTYIAHGRKGDEAASHGGHKLAGLRNACGGCRGAMAANQEAHATICERHGRSGEERKRTREEIRVQVGWRPRGSSPQNSGGLCKKKKQVSNFLFFALEIRGSNKNI
jgi:hypothetical protein